MAFFRIYAIVKLFIYSVEKGNRGPARARRVALPVGETQSAADNAAAIIWRG
jgi:hypothetical protein